ncbi:hypothetical protein F2P81_020676 [Scophthalmus maximus]|uniref:2'-deoxynucleoside 5'-phosphate N-hydrolase 1 n=1 Tax=Scophthalmus maximus TaxID=52904 RepID=A0A6A4S6R0_SCOMX|nr:hypothetical protein F2P81_020676 [Scophthalmus maximus]
MTSAVKRGATSSTRYRDTQTAREETHLWTRSVHVHVTMKIYFCGSIRGGRDDVMLYRKIVEKLQSYGTVLTEHVSSTELSHRVLSAMIRGADDGERFVVRDYGEDEVDEVLEEFFNALKRT